MNVDLQKAQFFVSFELTENQVWLYLTGLVQKSGPEKVHGREIWWIPDETVKFSLSPDIRIVRPDEHYGGKMGVVRDTFDWISHESRSGLTDVRFTRDIYSRGRGRYSVFGRMSLTALSILVRACSLDPADTMHGGPYCSIRRIEDTSLDAAQLHDLFEESGLYS